MIEFQGRGYVTLLGRLPEPARGGSLVSGNAVPALQQSGELELRLAITSDRAGQRRIGISRDRTTDA